MSLLLGYLYTIAYKFCNLLLFCKKSPLQQHKRVRISLLKPLSFTVLGAPASADLWPGPYHETVHCHPRRWTGTLKPTDAAAKRYVPQVTVLLCEKGKLNWSLPCVRTGFETQCLVFYDQNVQDCQSKYLLTRQGLMESRNWTSIKDYSKTIGLTFIYHQ